LAGTGEAAPGRRVRLGAALWNGDHGRFAEEVARLEAAGLDFLHIDVFDGYFVPDVAFSPRTIGELRKLTRLPFEVHLGVQEVGRFLQPLVEAGVDLILFHLECARMPFETAFAIHELGARAGVALSLGTPVAAVESLVPRIESLLLLSRVTGEGAKGASFDPGALPRLAEARRMIDAAGGGCELQVAGGINRGNVGKLVEKGATTLSLGAGIYKVPDMRREVQEIRRSIGEE